MKLLKRNLIMMISLISCTMTACINKTPVASEKFYTSIENDKLYCYDNGFFNTTVSLDELEFSENTTTAIKLVPKGAENDDDGFTFITYGLLDIYFWEAFEDKEDFGDYLSTIEEDFTERLLTEYPDATNTESAILYDFDNNSGYIKKSYIFDSKVDPEIIYELNYIVNIQGNATDTRYCVTKVGDAFKNTTDALKTVANTVHWYNDNFISSKYHNDLISQVPIDEKWNNDMNLYELED